MTTKIAKAEPRDRTFIIESWLESYRTSHTAGLIQMPDWFKVMRPQLEKLVDRPSMVTLVAHAAGDRDLLKGFVVGDPRGPNPLLVYVYVKDFYRKDGIARALVAELGIDVAKPFEYACSTAASSKLRDKIPLGRWRPLRARFPDEPQPRTIP